MKKKVFEIDNVLLVKIRSKGYLQAVLDRLEQLGGTYVRESRADILSAYNSTRVPYCAVDKYLTISSSSGGSEEYVIKTLDELYDEMEKFDKPLMLVDGKVSFGGGKIKFESCKKYLSYEEVDNIYQKLKEREDFFEKDFSLVSSE